MKGYYEGERGYEIRFPSRKAQHLKEDSKGKGQEKRISSREKKVSLRSIEKRDESGECRMDAQRPRKGTERVGGRQLLAT